MAPPAAAPRGAVLRSLSRLLLDALRCDVEVCVPPRSDAAHRTADQHVLCVCDPWSVAFITQGVFAHIDARCTARRRCPLLVGVAMPSL